ncbi:acyl-CoA dehydrogenase family protein [Mycolicibacterium thermoresistibile]
MDADTRDLLRDSLRAMFTCGGTDLLAELDEMGWAEVVSDDEAAAVELLFTEQGRAGAASAALDDVMLTAGGSELDGAVVVHPLARARPSVADGRLRVDGVALHAPENRPAVVLDPDIGALVLPGWTAEPVTGLAPRSRLHRVRLEIPLDDAGTADIDASAAIAAGRRALAAELTGAAEAMLELAVEHVSDRTQFGRPIGSYQATRHRLADAYAQIAAARELAGVAWRTRSAWDAQLAKAYAGWAAETTAAACMQVCGAIGLTLEHRLGGYVARARVLDALHGGWQDAVHAIGARLLDTATVEF